MNWPGSSHHRRLAALVAVTALAGVPASASAAPEPALWDVGPHTLTSLPDRFHVGTATFGPALATTPVVGDIEIFIDSAGDAVDGCEPESASTNRPVNGKLAIVLRGGCGFTIKAKNAQNAGALGLIVVNTVPGPAPGMAGIDPTITIPTVSLSDDDGSWLIANYNAQQRRWAMGLRDLTPPVVTVPANVSVAATSFSGAVVTFNVTATDTDDPSPTVTCDPSSGSTFPIGTTTVTCTAVDDEGNRSAPASFDVAVSPAEGSVIALGSLDSPDAHKASFAAALSCDPADSSHAALVEWSRPGNKMSFTATGVDSVICIDDPGGYESPAGFNTQRARLTGTITSHRSETPAVVDLLLVDGGPGAHQADLVTLQVRNQAGDLLFDVEEQHPGKHRGDRGGVWTVPALP